MPWPGLRLGAKAWGRGLAARETWGVGGSARGGLLASVDEGGYVCMSIYVGGVVRLLVQGRGEGSCSCDAWEGSVGEGECLG